MGFNPPVPQQDSNWEIRVAVLVSLIFQVILIFVGPLRKRSTSSFVRFVIWSCYLLADWVADLALGLLLNNMGNIGGGGGGGVGSVSIPSITGQKHLTHGDTTTLGSVGGEGGCSTGSSSPIIFAFWAPFLLLHLGGPDTITAYSLEDNELWLRHLIGFLFELSAATVVFFCSLRGNPMIMATPVMFIAGTIKYVERTYSLYYGSIEGFPVAILDAPDVRSTNIPKLMQAYSSRQKAGLVVEVATLTDTSNTLWDMDSGEEDSRDAYDGQDQLNAYSLFINFRTIFVNGVVSSRNLRMSETFFLALGNCPERIKKAFHILEIELSYMYDMLYTKMPVLNTTVGYVVRLVSWCCIISSVIIFASHDKASMLPSDIGITYALLFIAVALEATAFVRLLFSNWAFVYVDHSQHFKWLSSLVRCIQNIKKQRNAMWSGIVWQLNLIENSLYTIKHDNFALKRVINKIWNKHVLDCIKKDQPDYKHLLTFIFQRIQETVSVSQTSDQRKKACQARGDGALHELKECFKGQAHGASTIVLKSVTERDFDESLLIWHIATDLCLHMFNETPGSKNMSRISKCISEYLLYLLMKKPEMTSATMGIGQLRYKNTYEGAKLLFRSGEVHGVNIDHKTAAKMVYDMNTSRFKDDFIKGDRTKTVLFNACVLAKALKDSFTDDDRDTMWRVIACVWMEMLTFTASHTQPREHLKKLSNGGELITMVWLLMAHMGMTSSLFEVQETDSINKLITYDQ